LNLSSTVFSHSSLYTDLESKQKVTSFSHQDGFPPIPGILVFKAVGTRGQQNHDSTHAADGFASSIRVFLRSQRAIGGDGKLDVELASWSK
jgi:hypothetical protein